MGVSGDVLVTADDGTSLSSSGFAAGTASASTSDFLSGSSETKGAVGGGEGGGVDTWRDRWMMSAGGQARGEIIIPGACEGS